jgi:hypothetical protein
MKLPRAQTKEVTNDDGGRGDNECPKQSVGAFAISSVMNLETSPNHHQEGYDEKNLAKKGDKLVDGSVNTHLTQNERILRNEFIHKIYVPRWTIHWNVTF